MKKLLIATLCFAVVAIGATTTFAAKATAPPKELAEIKTASTSITDTVTSKENGTCINFDECPNNGVPMCDGTGCKNNAVNTINATATESQADMQATEIQLETVTTKGNSNCINNDKCSNIENCPNGGVPKRDGTGNKNNLGNGRRNNK